MQKIEEIVNRKPFEWADMSADEFERDIEMLQEFCRCHIKLERMGIRNIEDIKSYIAHLEFEINMNNNIINYLTEEKDNFNWKAIK
ncbi:hypothetical protein WKH57_01190 [Niallia taxi]|uniref:hypothetical protein n=1 Tax=Niallia taxi TaxID=2499688 RepID=UPI00317710D7